MASAVWKPGAMVQFQQSLPKLPVPPLQQTMDKYLKAIRPLLQQNEMERTAQIVEQFRKSEEAQLLQDLLERRAKEHTNWLSDWWLQEAYLAYRLPVVAHVSPATMFPPMPQFDRTEGWLKAISDVITMMMKWKHQVDTETLPPLKVGNKQVCSIARQKLVSSCRVPRPQLDVQIAYGPQESRHMIVAHNCQFFQVELFQPNSNTLLSPPQLYRQLEDVIKMSPDSSTPPVSERVGLLTTSDRDTWTKAYQSVTADDINAQSLESIQRSVALICLDQPNPDIRAVQDNTLFTHNAMTATCARGLHGNGVTRNSGNRWFDKPMQLYFGSDGGCGAILEHSVCDGLLAIDFLDRLLDYCNSSEAMSWAAAAARLVSAPQPRKLAWNLSDQTRLDILESAEKIDRLVDDTDLLVFLFKHFGKEFIKSTQHSPDAFMQVCIQLAYYRLYGKTVPTYESASTSQFELGRTETIRSATPEATAFSHNMDRDDISNEEKVQLVKDAIAAHVKYTKEATAGQGIDRHLLGLKLAALEAGLPTPKLFVDPSFRKVFGFKLSTSQVPSTHRLVLCFGAVELDGYGICYNPRQNDISIAVSSYRSCPHTDSGRMAAALERALLDVQALVNATVKSKL